MSMHPRFAATVGVSAVLLLAVMKVPTFAQQQIVPNLDVSGQIREWILDGSGSWEVAEGKLVLRTPGVPGGSIRRPAALAIVRADSVSRVSLTADVRSTAPVEVRQRDLQIIVGYQSPSRFYYVHLAGITDAVHNGIFLVADADRRRIDSGTAPPQLTDQTWHNVRVEWDGVAGSIQVFVDGSTGPALHATDSTLKVGRFGFGSFDDTGEFRNIRVTVWK